VNQDRKRDKSENTKEEVERKGQEEVKEERRRGKGRCGGE
jgi:hypothetical protein